MTTHIGQIEAHVTAAGNIDLTLGDQHITIQGVDLDELAKVLDQAKKIRKSGQ